MKELNGKVERSHRTDDEECYAHCDRRTITPLGLQQHVARWMQYYNTQRRHSAIGYRTPRQFFRHRQRCLAQLRGGHRR